MTNLDALTDELRETAIGCDHMVEFGLRDMCTSAADAITALRAENDRLSNLWQIEHDHATALRAQIDRERAATIEAAAKAINDRGAEEQRNFGLGRETQNFYRARDIVRALHTDATRAAMDAIRREGYEAGVRDADRQRHVNVDGTPFRYETVDLRNPRLAVSVPLYATTSQNPDEVEF